MSDALAFTCEVLEQALENHAEEAAAEDNVDDRCLSYIELLVETLVKLGDIHRAALGDNYADMWANQIALVHRWSTVRALAQNLLDGEP